ncbi:hypothetical protein [Actinomadura decatromicini]|uniref:Uncharacterized protein n=1 Tax=Actinomadura decatromicini TaxID=2604572 RepID=A0A5D3FIR1_9ACTN|nr:hypothetical protein [Actinomadura decatromicini]TYK47185.1 hypothetical protein FXF68_25640 [Actinomadura decatromicini]
MTGEGWRLRALLNLAANTVHPDLSAGLARIQARTKNAVGVPGCTPGRRVAAAHLEGTERP